MKSANGVILVAIVVAVSIHVGLDVTTDMSIGVRNYSAILGALAGAFVVPKTRERRVGNRSADER